MSAFSSIGVANLFLLHKPCGMGTCIMLHYVIFDICNVTIPNEYKSNLVQCVSFVVYISVLCESQSENVWLSQQSGYTPWSIEAGFLHKKQSCLISRARISSLLVLKYTIKYTFTVSGSFWWIYDRKRCPCIIIENDNIIDGYMILQNSTYSDRYNVMWYLLLI